MNCENVIKGENRQTDKLCSSSFLQFLDLCLDALLVCHLPDGPTAHFKLSSVKLSKDIKVRDA